MVFSSATFLFVFLPIFLILYFILPWKNVVITAASLIFYFWGESWYTALIIILALANYFIALAITSRGGRGFLVLGIAIDLGALIYFKYAGFLVGNLNPMLSWAEWPTISIGSIHLPLGLSFFTFHVLSYLIDIYRREIAPERYPLNVALYISMFPQLIAGPIIRFKTIVHDIHKHRSTQTSVALGIRFFIIGLGQKLVLANTAAGPADQIFALSPTVLDAKLAWLGALAYTLQIYFDFCGYSNMAIGLGLMMGMHFPINFNYPYVSQSITEFWRRWHMTLSAWFRDYVYVPLGGNRGGRLKTYRNLIIVFLLCGAWHGAEWTFIVWGAYHGIFLIGERLARELRISPPPRLIRHCYALLVVIVGWVFFRSGSIEQAGRFISAMAGFGSGDGATYNVWQYLPPDTALILGAAIVGCAPVLPWLADKVEPYPSHLRDPAIIGLLSAVLLMSAAQLATGTYSPFIYFRF
jgi:alginate O-acetyltransferase complex protein AlgI